MQRYVRAADGAIVSAEEALDSAGRLRSGYGVPFDIHLMDSRAGTLRAAEARQEQTAMSDEAAIDLYLRHLEAKAAADARRQPGGGAGYPAPAQAIRDAAFAARTGKAPQVSAGSATGVTAADRQGQPGAETMRHESARRLSAWRYCR